MIQAHALGSRGVRALSDARSRTAAALVLAVMLLAACAETPPRPVGEPVPVDLGPVIRVLDAPTSSEQVEALIDDAGLGHVLIVSPKAKTLRHVVVDPAGAISLNEVVRSNVSPAALHSVFDEAGQLHVLIDPKHLVRESSGNWAEAPTPWSAAGLGPSTSRFVPGNERNGPLLFAFDVQGKALGAPARWDVYGVGGYGAGIIWPWRTRGTRLAVVAEDGGRYDMWSVVDLDDNEDVADWRAIADPGGRVHIVYDAQRNVLAMQSLARYACVAPPGTYDPSTVREIAGHRIHAVTGVVVPVTPEAPSIGLSAALGFNPTTGELLLVRQHVGGRVLRDGAWGTDEPFPLELSWEPRVAPRAVKRFDVVVTGTRTDSTLGHERPVFYLQFRDGRWSAPVEVGGARVEAMFGWTWGAVQIASDGGEHVLVTWPVPEGIEARWLHLRGE